MKSIKLPKNESERADESNLGHTKDEWGTQKEKKINDNNQT